MKQNLAHKSYCRADRTIAPNAAWAAEEDQTASIIEKSVVVILLLLPLIHTIWMSFHKFPSECTCLYHISLNNLACSLRNNVSLRVIGSDISAVSDAAQLCIVISRFRQIYPIVRRNEHPHSSLKCLAEIQIRLMQPSIHY